MGSTVIANPALEKARRELNAEIFFLIFERNVDCLRLLPTVPEGNIVTIRETSVWNLALDSLRFALGAKSQDRHGCGSGAVFAVLCDSHGPLRRT